MRGLSATVAIAAAAFAGLGEQVAQAGDAMRGFGDRLREHVGKPGSRKRRRAEYESRKKLRLGQPVRDLVWAFEPGAKLARKAAEGRVGLTHPTRGTMATPSVLKPFSSRGLPPLTAMLPKPKSPRQWKKMMRELGRRSTPNCDANLIAR
jgi:hypothetical protein